MVEWTETQSLGFTRCTVTVGDYTLSIVGNSSEWVWTIHHQNRIAFQGLEICLASAKLTAETVALRVQDESEGDGVTAKWIETQPLGFTHYAVTVGNCALSITGNSSGWAWAVQQENRAAFQGIKKDLADAKRTAETIALRVQNGP